MVCTSRGYTEQIQCDKGVRQGCPLSPTLFALYTNDLMSEMNGFGVKLVNQNVKGLMYADDVALVAKSGVNLQAMLDSLSGYCDKWNLSVNTKKSKVMMFGGGRSDPGVLQFTYKGLKLEWVDSFRYLGVIFSRSCSFDLCVDTLTKSGQKAMMAMLSRAHLLGGLDIDIKCRLFDVLVAPILTYGCEVWGTKCYDSLEKTLLKFCKLLLGVPNSATTDAVLGELGRFPLWLFTQF